MKPFETATLLTEDANAGHEKRRSRTIVLILCAVVFLIPLIYVILVSVERSSAEGNGPFDPSETKLESTQSDHPNIILIMMDDLGFTDTPHYANPATNDYSFTTPNIIRFASEGIRLNWHYSEPVCSATRSSLLSGRYSWRRFVRSIF